MNKFFALMLVLGLPVLSSCQKQQTDEERKAQVEREVQQRLDAEHQAQEKQQLSQQQAELDAREKAIAEKEAAAAKTNRTSTGSAPRRDERQLAVDDRPTPSYNTFYTKLESHGTWLETSDYGYVWQPRSAEQSRTWRPYSNGHWVYTDAGWAWVSDEPFGWATYHYGRWTRLRNIGWVWVPGDEWAPAWVSWRTSNDYVGWAPLPPEARFDRRSGIHNWADNYYDIGPDQYCFVATNQFGAPRVEQAIVPPQRNVTIINQTTNVTNITYSNTVVINEGPSYDEIRTRSQQPIQRFRLERQVAFNAGTENYRPEFKGEVLEMTAPVIARAQTVERPRSVRKTTTDAVVDRGWEGVSDAQAAQFRAKVKSEATPPPNAPSRTFVKPVQATTAGSATAAESASPTASPETATAAESVRPSAAATQSPVVTRRPPVPVETPGPAKPTSPPAVSSPSVSATASASVSATAQPTSAPREISPSPASTPRSAASPQPSATAANQTPDDRPRVGGRLRSQAQKFQPRRTVPMGSPAASPGSSATPAQPAPGASDATGSGERFRRQRPERLKQGLPPVPAQQTETPSASVSPTVPAARAPQGATSAASPSPSASVASDQSDESKRGRRQRRNAESKETPTPSPSAVPQ